MRRGDRRDAALAGASPASAAGSHGPLTCLDGFVWRQATPRDHVCVTPEVRAQTARDNALAPAAAARRPAPSGPTCASPGYVWREALPGDHVCVTPATWQQVHDDNLTAGARRNALRVKVGTTDDRAPRYWVHADGINVGMARVGAVRPGRRGPRTTWPVRARRSATGPGGVLFSRHAAPRVRDPAERDHPRPRPVVAALVLVAPVATGCTGL